MKADLFTVTLIYQENCEPQFPHYKPKKMSNRIQFAKLFFTNPHSSYVCIVKSHSFFFNSIKTSKINPNSYYNTTTQKYE